RGLKTQRPERNPPTRTVKPHSDVRNEAQSQSNRGQAKPKPPCPLPKVVIDQCRHCTNDEPDYQPHRLAFHERVNVSVTFTGKSAGAKKHNDPDHQQPKNGDENEVSALTMHSVVPFFSFPALVRDQKFLADL